ncbi:MAG: gamma-glutamyl-gamma-aminobutyrate hydrolase family protein [Pyrinomonadaceae bacterium]
MAYRPKIGITMRLEHETNRFYLGRDYSEGLEAFGATPIHIGLIPNREYVADLMSTLDGVMLPGSASDIDPYRYGEDPHPKLGRVIPEKDEIDLLVLAEAERLGMPVFGICFGMQSLNISRGGSLIQDIESQVDEPVQHQQGIPRDRNSHSIRVEPESLLEKALGVDAQTVKVNSHHHQSIRNIGKNLRATAWANDGIVEAIEDDREGRIVIGVQWHPELSWKNDTLSGNLFSFFVESCRLSWNAKAGGS